ncbi:MAG: hypothetical protein ABW116_01830 [Candidatus Sedimenticola sp. 20ELBAFRAG]
MDALDTGNVRVTPVGDQCLLFTMYTNDEIKFSDIVQIFRFLDQFNGTVPGIVERVGCFSLPYEVQNILMKEAVLRFKALAYIDRNYRDRQLTHYAKLTYMKSIPVESFSDCKTAMNWLAQYGTLPSVVEI